jgi:hypothetical protein
MWRSSHGVVLSLLFVCALGGCGSANVPGVTPTDGPSEFSQPCVSLEGGICVPVAGCHACDAGECGDIDSTMACESQDEVCHPTSGGPACSCQFGMWSCPGEDGGTDAPVSPYAP